jgi:hypothetical protein
MATRNGGRTATRSKRGPIIESTPAHAVERKLDRESRRILGISGEVFIDRLRTGDIECSPAEMGLIALAELVRQDRQASYRSGRERPSARGVLRHEILMSQRSDTFYA